MNDTEDTTPLGTVALRTVRGSVRRYALAGKRFARAVLRKTPHIMGLLVAAGLLTSWVVYHGVERPPASFPVEQVITIPAGMTVTDVARFLREEHIIRSVHAFRLAVTMGSNGGAVIAGDYFFDAPLTLSEVAQRISSGTYGLDPIRITIPEGATTYQMAEIFARRLPKFDSGTFLLLAEEKEGYLFPDTYHFTPTTVASDVVRELERTFYERLRAIEDEIAAFGRPVHEIVTLASLLEKEARNHEERRKIAGILWHRLSIDMPLQVDAVFGFIARTETFNPRFSDLRIDSPYNTYKYRGLPPGPIASPSLSSLKAAVTPVETNALFYLHGRDGIMRSALTYDEHLVNRRRYLD